MSARAVKVNTVALGTGGCAEQTPHVHTVNGNKAVDSDAGLVEKELGTSQIPVAFFTDRTGEIDVADGLNFLFLQGAQHLKNDRKTAGIVADAGGMADTVFVDTDLDVGAGRENRILVRCKHQMRAFAL